MGVGGEVRYGFGVGEGRTLTIDNYGRNQSHPQVRCDSVVRR